MAVKRERENKEIWCPREREKMVDFEMKDLIPKLHTVNYYLWPWQAQSGLIERNCWNAVNRGFEDVSVADLNEQRQRTNRKALATC
jgi:hypothetical protein